MNLQFVYNTNVLDLDHICHIVLKYVHIVFIVMDLLSELLGGLKFDELNLAKFTLNAPWGINTKDFVNGFSLIVLEGSCWISTDSGIRERLSKGQSIIVPRGGTLEFSSSPNVTSHNLNTVWGEEEVGTIAAHQPAEVFQIKWGGTGEPCDIMGLAFTLTSNTDNDFHHKLPKYMLLKDVSADTAMITEALTDYLVSETSPDKPGEFAQKSRLAEAIAISQIRQYILTRDNSVGLIAGLRDPKIGKALAAIYTSYDERWTLTSLAQEAGMSRAVFAKKFRDLIGQTPLDYLIHWRIYLACQRLKTEKTSISQLASELGFGSDLAFRRNFTKIKHLTPIQWRSTQNNKNRN